MDQVYASIVIFLLLSACTLIVLTVEMSLWKKIVIAVSLMSCGILSYRTLNLAYGYAAQLQSVHRDTLILGYHADRANNKMYIWIKDNDGEPKVFSMPYSPKLHKKLEEGRKGHKGKPYKGTLHNYSKPLNKFDKSVEDIRLEILEMVPEKRKPARQWRSQ